MTMQAYKDVVSQDEAIKQQIEDAPNTVHLEQIMSLLKGTRQAGATTSSTQERENLRDILRYWGQYLNKNYDVYPDMHLAPFDESQIVPETSPEDIPVPVLSTQPIQVTSESVNPGMSQLKWVVGLMIGMIVLFFIIQVIFPPDEGNNEALPTVVVPDKTADASATKTQVALARSEAATAVSPKPTITATLEIIYATATLPPVPQTIEHTVIEGDTLFSIAKQYDTTVEAIQTTNNLDTEQITLGKVLVIDVVSMSETAVTQDAVPQTSPVVQPIATDADAVIRGNSTQGTTALLVAPEATAKEVQVVNAGTFVYTAGKTTDGSWLLVELNGRSVRGWVPAEEVGLLYPLTPENIPIIQTQ